MWQTLAHLPRFIATLLVLMWIVALEVYSSALWVIGFSFVLTFILALLSYAMLRVRNQEGNQSEVADETSNSQFFQSPIWIALPVVWQAVVLILVLLLSPEATYSGLSNTLLLVSIPPLPFAALQYHYIERRFKRK